MANSLFIQGDKVWGAFLGPINKVASNSTGPSVDWGFPQDDQRVTPDLTEAEVIGWA